MSRSKAVLTVLVLTGCGAEPALAPSGPPQLLIGGSPLMAVDLSDPNAAVIEVTTEVTRGLTIPKPVDVFLLRLTASFATAGGAVLGSAGPTDQGISVVKDEGLRGEGTVSIGACIDIPAAVLADLKTADATDGAANPAATVTVQLVLVDGDGKEHVLDRRSVSGIVDANGDG